jgi:hypothetical protein
MKKTNMQTRTSWTPGRRFIKDVIKSSSSSNSNEDDKAKSNEPGYDDEDEDQLEEEQEEETGEIITSTINQVF